MFVSRSSIVVSISACHAEDPGSIPTRRRFRQFMVFIIRPCRNHVQACSPPPWEGGTPPKLFAESADLDEISSISEKLFWAGSATQRPLPTKLFAESAELDEISSISNKLCWGRVLRGGRGQHQRTHHSTHQLGELSV